MQNVTVIPAQAGLSAGGVKFGALIPGDTFVGNVTNIDGPAPIYFIKLDNTAGGGGNMVQMPQGYVGTYNDDGYVHRVNVVASIIR